MSNIILDKDNKIKIFFSYRLQLNRYDMMYISFILLLSFLLILSGRFVAGRRGNRAIIRYDNREIMAVDLNSDRKIVLLKKDYPLLLDDMTIEVKNGKIAVIKEKSPYNYCSLSGFTDEAIKPIICQPNRVTVIIEDTAGNSGDIDMKTN